MRRDWRVRSAIICGLLVAGFVFVVGQSAQARPPYLNKGLKPMFEEPEAAKKLVAEQKCLICHLKKEDGEGADPKKRNAFAAKVGEGLGKKNQTDEAKIKEAIEKALKEKSKVEGKTFGDLIKDGKLPVEEEKK